MNLDFCCFEYFTPNKGDLQGRRTKAERYAPVGVDAALSPAVSNCKITTTIGENEKRSVGADDPVRPWGNNKFAAAHRKNGCTACGSMWASTPTNMKCICIGAFVFAGASCRADRVVRPYGCVRVCIGVFYFVTLCRAGGASPAPTLRRNTMRRKKSPGGCRGIFPVYSANAL